MHQRRAHECFVRLRSHADASSCSSIQRSQVSESHMPLEPGGADRIHTFVVRKAWTSAFLILNRLSSMHLQKSPHFAPVSISNPVRRTSSDRLAAAELQQWSATS